jgi:L-fuculose-phosphate aldolase
MNLDSPQLKVAMARRILHRAGLDPNDMSGQVTLRADDGRSYWTSPMETFDVTVPGSVVRLPFDVGPVEAGVAEDGRIALDAGGPVPASTASGWIGAIYQNRPDVKAVIHTHAPYIGAVATTGRVVGLYNNRSVIFHGDQAFYDDDGTATDSRDGIVGALARFHVLIMRNHGAVVVGETIEMATMRAVLLEEAARFQVHAQSIGGTPFPDSDALVGRRVAHVGNLARLWDSHVRRVMRTDGDLFATTTIEPLTRPAAQDRLSSGL